MSGLPQIDAESALFLDFDGTLIELAPQPSAVRTAPELIATLGALNRRLRGALAIVSGRRRLELDAFLAPLKLALAAEHGAILRFVDGREWHATPPDLAPVVKLAAALADEHPGLLLERKSSSVALHYRAAPQLASLCLDRLAMAVATLPGLELLRGKFVAEVKSASVNKGSAIMSLMASEPFKGRRPLFAGDDVTDEAGFACIQAAGGHGIKVGEGSTLAGHACESPAELRRWLQRAVADTTATDDTSARGTNEDGIL